MSSPTAETRWTLAAERPLAFGGWEFIVTGPDVESKRLEWWPGYMCLSWQTRPVLGAPVPHDTGKAARAAAHEFVARLNREGS